MCPGLMLVSRCQGVRDAKESKSVSCEVSCEVSRRCVLQGVWPQWSGCLQGMSSTYDESLSGCGRVPVKGVSPVVPVELKRPSACSPVLPVNGLLEQDQSPCGRGSIVVDRL